MLKIAMRAAALCIAIAALAGCGEIPHVDAYSGVPYDNAFFGDTVPDQAYFKAQDDTVIPHCAEWAKDTNPTTGKAAAAFGVNHGVAGFFGGFTAAEAQGGIVGGPVTAPYAASTGVWSALNDGPQAAMSGAEMVDQQRHSGTIWCMLSNTGGYHVVTQREKEEMRKNNGFSATLQAVVDADRVAGKPVGMPPTTP